MATMLKPKSKAVDLVPDGNYKAELSKVTQFTNAYGLRVGFEFTLLDNGVLGYKVLKSTSTQLSASGNLADTLRGILGRELTAEELTKGIDVDALVGTQCGVMVMQSKNKTGAVYSNVQRIFPLVALK
jgi:hypothetical protein